LPTTPSKSNNTARGHERGIRVHSPKTPRRSRWALAREREPSGSAAGLQAHYPPSTIHYQRFSPACMAKAAPQIDVLVLGQHPCAYLAAELLGSHSKGSLGVAHATIPGDNPPSRLVIHNRQLFALSKPLEKMRKKLELTAVWGTAFLGHTPETRGEWRTKSPATPVALIGCYSELRKSFAAMAKESGAKMITPKSMRVLRVDEKGFEIQLDHHTLRPRALLLAGNVSGENAKALALPEAFAADVMRRYSFLRLHGSDWAEIEAKPLLPMSVDV